MVKDFRRGLHKVMMLDRLTFPISVKKLSSALLNMSNFFIHER